MGITFSMKHHEFALVVRHSEWILNHLVRNDFWMKMKIVWSRRHPTSVTLVILLRDQFAQSYFGWSTWWRTATFLVSLLFGVWSVLTKWLLHLHSHGVTAPWRVTCEPLGHFWIECVRVENNTVADDGVWLENSWLQNVSECAVPKKVGIQSSVVREFFLEQYQTRCGQWRQQRDF